MSDARPGGDPPVRLTDPQRRHLGLMLEGLSREARERLDRWDAEGIPGRAGDLARSALEDVARRAEDAAVALGVEITREAPRPARRLASWSSVWWSTVLSSRPSTLRAYGRVAPGTAEVLAPIVESLAEALLRLKALAEESGKLR